MSPAALIVVGGSRVPGAVAHSSGPVRPRAVPVSVYVHSLFRYDDAVASTRSLVRPGLLAEC